MESGAISEPSSPSPMETKLDKPKPNRKLLAKFTGLPIQETPKQHKTPQKKKLMLEQDESAKKRSIEGQQKTQNVQETLEDMDKELAKLVQAEKKELLNKINDNKRAAGRLSTGKIEKTPVVKRARSSVGSWASFNSTKSVTPPKDEDLPDFDPEKFSPGYVPKTVKKGDEEYVIVVSGVPDTGLCGKYWGDLTSLPSRRRKATPYPLTASTKTTAKNSTPSVDVEQPATFTSPKTTATRITPSVDVETPATLNSTPKITAKKNTSSVDVVKPAICLSTPKTTGKDNHSSVDNEKLSTLTTTPKITAKMITSSVYVENLSVFATTSKTNAKKNSSTVDVDKPSTLTSTPKTTAKSTPVNVEQSTSLEPKKSLKKMASATSAPEDMPGAEGKAEEIQVEEMPQLKMRTGPKQSQECSQLDIKGRSEPKLTSNQSKETLTHQYQEHTELATKGLELKLLTDESSSLNSENLKGEPVDVNNTAGSSSLDLETTPFTTEATTGQLKAISCSSVNTPVEVMVDCYARRDDHRWINMGKKDEGMALDAVQYTRALRPAYHLLSFLRIKGHSSKGMSRTDKNTMVFVVMEGEVRVTIHTSQFSAKKGDSFYVPPMNSYNLINEKASEAELSLIQFTYDGPLSTAAQAQN